MAKRTSTATAAAAGTAISRPTKPNSAPKANSANISQTGCRPTLLPTSRGCRMLPSMNWPTKNTAATAPTISPVRPELDERDADRQHQADQRADIGNEADQAGEQADQDAEIQPGQRQPDRVDDAEHQAERALPAHEAGGRRVDVGGDRADRLDMVARHPAVDLGDHAVPVEQHVEGDHRRHDEQAGDAEQRHARAPDRLEDRRDEADAGGQQRVQPFAQRCRRRRRSAFSSHSRIEAGDQRLQPAADIRGSLPRKSESCEARTGIRIDQRDASARR